jgi:YVTN family beta-propeller protein
MMRARILSCAARAAQAAALTLALATCFGDSPSEPDPPTQLAIVSQPAGTVASGSSISLQIAVQNASGATVTSATPTITVVLEGTTAATLGGTTSQAAVNGVATFNNLTVDKVGTGFTLKASASDLGLIDARSSAFAVTPGPAAKLVITTQPTSAVSGAPISPALQVALQDAAGNTATSDSRPVSVAFAAGTGPSGATLGGTRTVNAVAGVATFSTLTIDKAGSGFALTATASSVSDATSSTFIVTAGAPATITINVGDNQTAVAGSAVVTPPSVTLTDANGNVVSGATVTFAVASGGGSVTGGTQTTNALGVATVGSWTMGTAGTNTLTVSSAGVTSVTITATATMPITVASFNGIYYGVGTGKYEDNTSFTVSGTVTVVNGLMTLLADNAGYTTATVSATGAVAFIIAPDAAANCNPTAGSGQITLNQAGGAVFTGTAFQNDRGFSQATGTCIPGSMTFAFSATRTTATQIAVAAGNGQTTFAGSAVAVPPSVIVKDANNNPVSGAHVTFAVATGGGSITSASQTTNANGLATLTSWTLGATPGANTVTATAVGLTGSPITFSATGISTNQLALTTSAVTAPSGVPFIRQPIVTVRDAGGNTIVGDNSTVVTMTVSAGATVVGSATATAAAGVATFNNVGIAGSVGTNYTLTFSTSGLTAATQTVAPSATATSAEFAGVWTGNIQTGLAELPTVAFTLTLSESGGIVSGTTSEGNLALTNVSVTNGVLSFSVPNSEPSEPDCNNWNVTVKGALNGAKNAMTFGFAGVVCNAPDDPLTTINGTGVLTKASALVLTTAAAGAPSGAAFTTQPVVTIRDAAGNTLTSNSTTVVTMTVSAGATVVGTATATASAGVASFANVGISGSAGTSYTLTFSTSGITSATQSITLAGSPLATIPQVSGGYGHTCALRSNGTVVCWGRNTDGESTVPAGLASVARISTGIHHTCALKTDGTVTCWGLNSSGQATVPAGLSSVASIATGGHHTCALKTDQTLTCWGNSSYGELTVPGGIGPVLQVAAGQFYTCALKAGGTVACWGASNNGRTDVPVGLSSVTQIESGDHHTCALKADQTVVCWGGNGYGQLNVPAALAGVAQVSAGGEQSCAVKTDGAMVCWGGYGYGEATVPSGLVSVVQATTGWYHTCALTSLGTITCWGWNNEGQTNVPAEFSAAGSSLAYVMAYSNAMWKLNKIAISTNTVVHTLADASFGSGVAITPSEAHVYVSANPLKVVSTATNTVVASVSGSGSPGAWQSAVAPNGAFVYVANHVTPGSVTVISTATNAVVATVPVGNHPFGLAVTPNSAFVYTANTQSSSVSVISTATNAVVATIPVGTQPTSVAISPDGTKAYVGHGGPTTLVTVISTATNAVLTTFTHGANNAAMAITPNGSFLYVANEGLSTVSVIATATNAVVTSIPVGSSPVGIAITSDGAFAYVTNYNSPFVSVIATATNTVVASITTGGQGGSVTIKR